MSAAEHTAGGVGGGVTLTTALEFFAAEKIAYEQLAPGVLHVGADEFERAAWESAERARWQRMRNGASLYLGAIVSGLAAMSIVPRLRASSGL